MSAGLLVTLCGLAVAALSAMLGVWVERDPKRPPRYAIALSALILMSTFVGLAQAYLKHLDGQRAEAAMARILDDLDQMASRDPTLDSYVSEQIRVQAAANPEVINLLAQRVEARGDVAATVLKRRGLDATDLENLGLQPMQKEASAPATSEESVDVPAAPVAEPAAPVAEPATAREAEPAKDTDDEPGATHEPKGPKGDDDKTKGPPEKEHKEPGKPPKE